MIVGKREKKQRRKIPKKRDESRQEVGAKMDTEKKIDRISD